MTDRILWLLLDAIACVTWRIYQSHRRGGHGSNFLTAVTYNCQWNSKLYAQKNNYVPNPPVELAQWLLLAFANWRDCPWRLVVNNCSKIRYLIKCNGCLAFILSALNICVFRWYWIPDEKNNKNKKGRSKLSSANLLLYRLTLNVFIQQAQYNGEMWCADVTTTHP